MEQEAIEAALFGNWKRAIKLNKKILSENKCDTEALCRLAYAFAKCSDFKKACFTYRKLLKIDPTNPIACKNLAKFKEAKESSKEQKKFLESGARKVSPSLFFSELAKAKSVDLINIAPLSVLQNLVVGEEVNVQKRRFDLQVKDKSGTYIGTFPDDVGRKLLAIFDQSKTVNFFLKDVRDNEVTVFIKWS